MTRQDCLLTLMCVWALFSCSDQSKGKAGGKDSGSGGGGDAGARSDVQSARPVSTFLADYIRAYCELSVRCGEFPDQSTCERYMLYNKRYAQATLTIDYAVSSGRTTFHPEHAASCLDPIATLSCSRTVANQVDISGQCAPVFQGTIADGETCVNDTECVSGSCSAAPCPTDGSCCQNRCTPSASPPQPLGSTCDWNCVAGAYCDRSSVPGTCRARLAVGQTCTSIDDCVAGLACVPYTGPRTCTPYVPNGQACNSSGAPCDDLQSYCDAVRGTCIPLGKPGSTCSDSSQCLTYASCVAGVCQTRPQEGEACAADAGSDARCLVGSCVQGLCTVGPTPQTPCTLSLDGGT